MAIPWLIALKSIPWGTVIKHGPRVFDKARDMVNRHREAKEAPPVYSAPHTDTGRPPTVEELGRQVIQMQQALSELSASHKALRQSVAELAQQNRQLDASVATLLRRVMLLVAGLVVIAAVLGWKMWSG